MKFGLKNVIYIVLASIFIFFQKDAFAAKTTEWMNATEFRKFSARELRRNGNVPLTIRCKPTDVVKGLSPKNTLLKVSYGRKPGTRWTWAWGDRVQVSHRKRLKEGYKRVSFDSTRRKSGLKLECAIWHKKDD